MDELEKAPDPSGPGESGVAQGDDPHPGRREGANTSGGNTLASGLGKHLPLQLLKGNQAGTFHNPLPDVADSPVGDAGLNGENPQFFMRLP